MASNSTATDSAESRKETNTAIAIVLPSIFAIVLFMILAVTYLLPRMSARETQTAKEERKKKRMDRLDESIKAQSYAEWTKRRKPDDGAATLHPVCVICLEEVDESARIRPLRCLHVFHQACLDDWFARWNEYCPLCHAPILSGVREVKRKYPEPPPPVAFMV
ncbi:uncharacterized protein EI97DRAFT_431952 [Westerdykella ornata]|uniref:RING-type domain-containing protein n=1 Tax=Westerdykella ornata TaxID=318751 RepID=A0A6A6JMP7_WESOR|nr:uncharacterized protein EI97DRAFT_431952 [Westerdykella ornata]KAF2277871.1 hypothetical protein EI97DRAFT_431952 [Westerdykella ornata]